jgi:hypothetical protein
MKRASKNEVAPQAGDNTLSALIPANLVIPGDQFVPCPKTLQWIRDTFLNEDSPLYNVEHDHLNSAQIGVLWTNAYNSRHGKQIVGTAELAKPPASLSKWAKARWEHQMKQWFGDVALDFVITLYAPYFAAIEELNQCASAEHELYHCGQQKDGFGLPKFNRTTGKPLFTIRGHDAEEFVGIYRRYGYQAGAGDSVALVEAAMGKPEIGAAQMALMCGTCK